MKKLVFLVALFLVCVSLGSFAIWHYKYHLYSYLPSTPDSMVKNVDGILFGADGKAFSGRLKEKTDSGSSVYAYKSGKLSGLNVVFSDGLLREIGHWQNGKQNGLFAAWTDKSVLIDRGFFKNGERDGETLQYWSDTGKIKLKAHYRAGKLNGLVEQYYPQGTLQFKHMYKDHKLHGEAFDYFENGKLKSYVVFDRGLQSGPFKLYSEDGVLLEEGILKEGMRHGAFTVYSPQTGKPAIKGNYNMNAYDGEITMWRADGVKSVQNFDKGVANGWQKTYNSQGTLIQKIMLKNGQATGEFYTYDAKGNLIAKRDPDKTDKIRIREMPSTSDELSRDNSGIVIIESN